ncbi:MAG: hypothetical protein D3924_06150, partial [Candidatus Electrothrix sp. AR4]|nr:hypothetical protein [Candidatus Electrothrix sp. AR4]
IRHLHALGILDSRTVCVHSVWIDERDVDHLAETGTGIAVCPQSNLKLASGIAPLKSMLDRGIQVGIGTDGAASNNSLDLFREMDICAKINKLPSLDSVAVPAADILEMATLGGASLLGADKSIGALEPGKKADLILINLEAPHLQPIHTTDLLVYAADGCRDPDPGRRHAVRPLAGSTVGLFRQQYRGYVRLSCCPFFTERFHPEKIR